MNTIWLDRLTFTIFFLLMVGLLIAILKVLEVKGTLYVLGFLVLITGVAKLLHLYNKKLNKILDTQ